MIYGVTHDEDGAPIERVIVSYKIAVGLHPTAAGKNFPVRLDQFVACKRSSDRKDKGVFVIDEELTKELVANYANGGPLMEIDIVLRSADPEKILKTQYAWRAQNYRNALLCHGDGKDAARKWEALTPDEKKSIGGDHDAKEEITFGPDQEIIPRCGMSCPHLKARHCKPSADLYFLLPERTTAGALATLHTGGWEATRRLASSLYQIFEEVESHGGSLLNLRLKLVARPYRASYKDKDGKEDSSTQLAFNLEFRRADYKHLLPEMIKESRQLTESLPEIYDVEGLNDEEIAEEFHPTIEQQEAQRKEEEAQTQRPPVNRPAALHKVVQQTQAAKDKPLPTVADCFNGAPEGPTRTTTTSHINDDDQI